MYTRLRGLLSAGLFLVSLHATAQLDLPRGSQMAQVSQRIGITDVSITYSRPQVNGREVWGSLVPYGMNNLGFGTASESPWRAGANENTVIQLSHDVQVEGKPLAAGTYGLHMILHDNRRATLIFSHNSTAWGSYFYAPEEDALRVDVTLEEHPHTEWLTYSFTDLQPGSATARLNWANLTIPFRISVDVPDVVLTDIRQKLQNQEGFNRQTWEQAAAYALNNGGDLEEALGWADAAISGQFFSQKTFPNLQLKAQILQKLNRAAEADALMAEALEMGTVLELHGYARQLLAQGNAEKAMAVFRKNAELHKGTWPVDYGMARGYSGLGDYKRALRHLKIAQERAPDVPNRDAIAANIEKLERGEDIN